MKLAIPITKIQTIRKNRDRQKQSQVRIVNVMTLIYLKYFFLVTSSNPTLLSSPKIEEKLKIEEEDIYDEDDDGIRAVFNLINYDINF